MSEGTSSEETGQSPGAHGTPDTAELARLVFERDNDGILVQEPGGRIVWADDGAARLFGIPAPDLAGTDIMRLVAPAWSDVFANNLGRALADGRARFDTAWRNQEGRVLYAEITALRFSSGTEPALLVLSRDISGRIRREQRLQELKNFFRAIIHATGEALLVMSRDERILMANPAAEHLFGHPHGDLVNEPAGGVLDPASLRRFRDAFVRSFVASDGREAVTIEVVGLNATGGLFPLECSLSTGTVGAAHIAIVMCRDITDRKFAEAALRESDERLRLITETSTDMIHLYNNDGTILYVNPATERLLGYRAAELVNTDIRRCILAEDLPAFEAMVSQLLEGARSIPPRELRFLTVRGAVLQTEVSGFLNRLTPDLCCLGTIIRDVGERKRREEERKTRTRQEAVAVVAQGIANDFNNLLSTVVGNISLAKVNAGDQSPIIEMLRTAERAGMQLRHLVRRLVTIAGEDTAEREPVDVRTVITEAVELTYRGSRVNCRTRIPNNLPAVLGDSDLLIQALHHLISNAEEAMPRGGKVIVEAETVDLREDAEVPLPPGRYIRIAVRDRGVGIPKEAAARIFDPFYTTKAGRSGLGLAVVSSIVRQHKGHVSFQSGEGGETVFLVFLPTTDVMALVRDDVEPPAGRVLVMDDEDGVRSMAARMLQYLGHTVETAADGEEALGLFTAARDRGVPFDLVILDLAVPGGMGGEETLRRLRDLDPGIKAVVMSGYAMNPVMRNHRAYGFIGLLRKPFELDEMRRVVNTSLTGIAPEPADHHPGPDQDRWVQEPQTTPRFRRRF